MTRTFRINNMTTLSPMDEFEQFMDNFTSFHKWGKVFDLEKTFEPINNKDKYPKYTILKHKEDDSKRRIKIAAAGMNKDDFIVTTLKNKLCVKYEPKCVECDEWEVMENNIGSRAFTQYFTAPEAYIVKVEEAEIKDGILIIDVNIEIPEDMKETEYKIK